MSNQSVKSSSASTRVFLHRPSPVSNLKFLKLFLISGLILTIGIQSSCLLRRGKAPKPAPPITRLVLLPFNVPENNADLKWAALAAPIMMAIVSERARDLEIVPLWQTMPTAVEAAGASRIINEESAAALAGWFSAKWSVMGELNPARRTLTMTIDFIPAKANLVAFRFSKSGRLDYLGSRFPNALNQFLYYLGSRPLLPAKGREQTFSSLKSLAETLDREYGWFVEAQPGKAQAEVSDLANSNIRLARLLFSPTIYPLLAPDK